MTPLALCPEVAQLPIRAQEIVAEDGTSRLSLSVFCARRGSSTPLPVCAECPECHGWQLDPDGKGGELTCHVLDREPSRQAVISPAMTTQVRDVMSTRVLCVESNLEVEILVQYLQSHGIDSVPVVDDKGAPMGIVSREDILNGKSNDLLDHPCSDIRALSDQMSWGTRTVRDVMTAGAFVLLESAPLARAAALMAYENATSILAISQHGEVVGILRALDIARWLANSEGFSVPKL